MLLEIVLATQVKGVVQLQLGSPPETIVRDLTLWRLAMVQVPGVKDLMQLALVILVVIVTRDLLQLPLGQMLAVLIKE